MPLSSSLTYVQVLLAALIPDVPGDIELLQAREYYMQHQLIIQELTAADDEKDRKEISRDIIIE